MPAASLILNSPYTAPTRYWQPGTGGALVETAGRRPASYEIFDIRNNTRRSEPLARVNEIRGRVDDWRAADYPGATAVSRRLLEHWRDATVRVHPFYFAQLEAIESLIWWVEGSAEFRQGIFLPGDGGPWERRGLCAARAGQTGDAQKSAGNQRRGAPRLVGAGRCEAVEEAGRAVGK